ncbi:hypothetical protein NP493_2011g00021 [Ridgeia piscesae]|uniref:Uncharacterized protein n=1 Tax=Ridgeia piscesae TaxID=27915 RepID=A0AAD9JP53_RIDPI|nr:hypothetical protein NP493_2011g00021 [Ridgeia piscesae]
MNKSTTLDTSRSCFISLGISVQGLQFRHGQSLGEPQKGSDKDVIHLSLFLSAMGCCSVFELQLLAS